MYPWYLCFLVTIFIFAFVFTILIVLVMWQAIRSFRKFKRSSISHIRPMWHHNDTSFAVVNCGGLSFCYLCIRWNRHFGHKKRMYGNLGGFPSWWRKQWHTTPSLFFFWPENVTHFCSSFFLPKKKRESFNFRLFTHTSYALGYDVGFAQMGRSVHDAFLAIGLPTFYNI